MRMKTTNKLAQCAFECVSVEMEQAGQTQSMEYDRLICTAHAGGKTDEGACFASFGGCGSWAGLVQRYHETQDVLPPERGAKSKILAGRAKDTANPKAIRSELPDGICRSLDGYRRHGFVVVVYVCCP